MSAVVFRCDGDDRVGAGHVSRSLRIAQAFAGAGAEVVFAGRYEGVAEALLADAGVAVEEPAQTEPAGIPARARAAVVDSYEIPATEVEQAAASLPLAVISDGGSSPAGAVVLDYHRDWAYVPVDPRYATARRQRGVERALVTLGGGGAGEELRRRIAERVGGLAGVAVLPPPEGPARMIERVREADVAITAAGFTPYELACAGVPSAIVAIAENQQVVARAFLERGLALPLERMEELADPEVRARLAAAGPREVDGYGSFRARDALAAQFAGMTAPSVLRYRPAGSQDADLLLSWRNDPDVRAASHNTAEITRAGHTGWLRAVLEDEARVLLVVEDGEEPAGSVRFDLEAGAATISVVVAPGRRGSGTGAKAIRESSELVLAMHRGLNEVVAEVRAGNERSLGAFERAGFRPAGEGREGSARLVLDRAGLVGGPAAG